MIHRCRTRADFARIRRDGVRRSGSLMWLRYVDDGRCDPPRVAFALGRSTGSAPARNKLRRQLRALFRDQELQVRPGLYLVGLAGPLSGVTFSRLRSDIEVLLR